MCLFASGLLVYGTWADIELEWEENGYGCGAVSLYIHPIFRRQALPAEDT